MMKLAVPHSESSWSNVLRIGAAASIIGASFLIGGCEQSEAELRQAALLAKTPSIREVLQHPEQYQGQELRFDCTPTFVVDRSSLTINSKPKYGRDYLRINVHYELKDGDQSLPALIVGTRQVRTGTYRFTDIQELSSGYRLPEDTKHVLGTLKLFTDSGSPYLEVSNGFHSLD